MAEIVVGGAACRCTQGSAPCALDIVANSRTIGGKTIANENDAQSCLDGFGNCRILSDINDEQTPCDPSKILKMWVGCDERFFGCGELSAIITTSVLFCTVGGVIFIVESGQDGENKVTNVGEMRLNYAEDMFEVIMTIASYMGKGGIKPGTDAAISPDFNFEVALYDLFRFYSSDRDRIDSIEFSEGSMLGLLVYYLAKFYGLREAVQNATYDHILAGEPGGLLFVANSPIVVFGIQWNAGVRVQYVLRDRSQDRPRYRAMIDAEYRTPNIFISTTRFSDLARDINHACEFIEMRPPLGSAGSASWSYFRRNGVRTPLLRNTPITFVMNPDIGVELPMATLRDILAEISIPTGFVQIGVCPNPGDENRRIIPILGKRVVEISVSVTGEGNPQTTFGYLVNGIVYPECLKTLLGHMFFEIDRVRGSSVFARLMNDINEPEIEIPLEYSTIPLGELLNTYLRPRLRHENSNLSGSPRHVRISIHPDNIPRAAVIVIHDANGRTREFPATSRGRTFFISPETVGLICERHLDIRFFIPGTEERSPSMGRFERSGVTTRLNIFPVVNGEFQVVEQRLDRFMNEVSIPTGFYIFSDPDERDNRGRPVARIRRTRVNITTRYRTFVGNEGGRLQERRATGYSVNGVVYPEDLRELLRAMFYNVIRNEGNMRNSTVTARVLDSKFYGVTPFERLELELEFATITVADVVRVLYPQIVCSIDLRDSTPESLFIDIKFYKESIMYHLSILTMRDYEWNIRVVQLPNIEDLHPEEAYVEGFGRVMSRLRTIASGSSDDRRHSTSDMVRRIQSNIAALVLTTLLLSLVGKKAFIVSMLLNALGVVDIYLNDLIDYFRSLSTQRGGDIITASTALNSSADWFCYYVYIWSIGDRAWIPCFMFYKARIEVDHSIRMRDFPALFRDMPNIYTGWHSENFNNHEHIIERAKLMFLSRLYHVLDRRQQRHRVEVEMDVGMDEIVFFGIFDEEKARMSIFDVAQGGSRVNILRPHVIFDRNLGTNVENVQHGIDMNRVVERTDIF